MENGVQALKLGASMLIFVIAITITISVFTMAVQALNRIFIAEEDQKYVTVGGKYLNFVNFEGGTREVGIDTIVPSIYRAFSENYCIYFYKVERVEADGTKVLVPLTIYTIENEAGEITEINWIGQENDMIPDKDKKKNNITAEDLFNEKGIYDTLKDKTFIEMLGEYIIGEEAEDEAGETPDEEETDDIPEGNKIKKRIIVYIEK